MNGADDDLSAALLETLVDRRKTVCRLDEDAIGATRNHHRLIRFDYFADRVALLVLVREEIHTVLRQAEFAVRFRLDRADAPMVVDRLLAGDGAHAGHTKGCALVEPFELHPCAGIADEQRTRCGTVDRDCESDPRCCDDRRALLAACLACLAILVAHDVSLCVGEWSGASASDEQIVDVASIFSASAFCIFFVFFFACVAGTPTVVACARISIYPRACTRACVCALARDPCTGTASTTTTTTAVLITKQNANTTTVEIDS